MSAGLHTFLETLRKNPCPCLFQLLEAALMALLVAPSSFREAHSDWLSSCHAGISLVTLLPLSSTFRDPYDYIGSNWIIQDDLPMLI